MSRMSRTVYAFSLAALLATTFLTPPAAAQSLPPPSFSHEIVTRDADRLAERMRGLAASEAGRIAALQPKETLRTAGLAQLADGKNPREALRLLTLATAIDAKDRQAWLGLAQAALAIPPDSARGSERYELPATASGAAWCERISSTAGPSRTRRPMTPERTVRNGRTRSSPGVFSVAVPAERSSVKSLLPDTRPGWPSARAGGSPPRRTPPTAARR